MGEFLCDDCNGRYILPKFCQRCDIIVKQKAFKRLKATNQRLLGRNGKLIAEGLVLEERISELESTLREINDLATKWLTAKEYFDEFIVNDWVPLPPLAQKALNDAGSQIHKITKAVIDD